jgi:chorismate mutase
MSVVRGLRGATTAESNTKEAILEATKELLGELGAANDLKANDIAAIFFTTTKDLNAEFPAVAARQMGWEHTALMCGHEMDVPDGQARCIRVLILVNTDRAPHELKTRYLRGAKNLRKRGMEGG